MLDKVRTSLHRLLTTSAGDGFVGIRLPRDLARRVNMTLGDPLCSPEELERRRAGREKLAKLRSGELAAAPAPIVRVAAPITIYFEKDRNARLLGRIRETLAAKNLAFTELDVSADEVAKAYAMREAQCKEDDLPIVFVATTPVGGYNALVEWDVSGKLESAVYGTPNAKAS
ncbi:MAG: hypothetical protein JWP97_6813 [Labilithrix sp.]|nr:hypothetical protein [Labilithrix sp.]